MFEESVRQLTKTLAGSLARLPWDRKECMEDVLIPLKTYTIVIGKREMTRQLTPFQLDQLVAIARRQYTDPVLVTEHV